MKKAIFFDLYGTLIDIKTDEYDPWLYHILSRYLSYLNLYISPEEFKNAYFLGVESYLKGSDEKYPEVDVYEVFKDILFNGLKRVTKDRVLTVASIFRSLSRRHFSLFPHLPNVLLDLKKRYRLGIISDAQWVFAEPEMKMTGLTDIFDLKFLSSRFGFKKPDVRLFNLAIERLGVKAKDSVYIGDNPHKDLIGAKMAGMRFILFRSECKCYNGFQPDRCFNDYSELKRILSEMA